MAKVIWTPTAESDLDDILYYIALVDRRPSTAERIYFQIRNRIQSHAAKKVPGQKHSHAPSGWLYIRHKRWLIFYQSSSEVLEVMRVVDASRDLPREFEGM